MMANLHTAQQLIEDGNQEAAIEILNAALRENPNDPRVLSMLWDALGGNDEIETQNKPALADPGATYTAVDTPYWPDGGNIHPFSALQSYADNGYQPKGLCALESRMKGYGMIEPYDQAEVDWRNIKATIYANEQRERERQRAIERRNKIVRRLLMVVGFIGYFPVVIAIDDLMGWERGTILAATVLGAFCLVIIGLLVLWIASD